MVEHTINNKRAWRIIYNDSNYDLILILAEIDSLEIRREY